MDTQVSCFLEGRGTPPEGGQVGGTQQTSTELHFTVNYLLSLFCKKKKKSPFRAGILITLFKATSTLMKTHI